MKRWICPDCKNHWGINATVDMPNHNLNSRKSGFCYCGEKIPILPNPLRRAKSW